MVEPAETPSSSLSESAEETLRRQQELSPPPPSGLAAGPTSPAAPPSNSSSPPSPWAGLTDRWGRGFDAALHKVDGKGRPCIRGGKTLIVLPGKQGAVAPFAASTRTPIGKLNASPDDEEEEEQGAASTGKPGAGDGANAGAQPGGQPGVEPRLAMTDEEMRAKAKRDAKLMAKGEQKLIRLLMGKENAEWESDEEHSDVEGSAFDWLYNDGVRLPFGYLVLHLIHFGLYGARAASTEEGRSNLRRFVRWVRSVFGREPPEMKDERGRPAPAAPAAPERPAPEGKPEPAGGLDGELERI